MNPEMFEREAPNPPPGIFLRGYFQILTAHQVLARFAPDSTAFKVLDQVIEILPNSTDKRPATIYLGGEAIRVTLLDALDNSIDYPEEEAAQFKTELSLAAMISLREIIESQQ